MQKVLAAIGAAVAGVMIYANLPTRLTLPFRQMDVKNLSKALLLNFDNRDKFEAKNLWQNNGAVIMAVRRPGCLLCREEGSKLSSLKPEFEKSKFNLYAVAHEEFGVDGFKPYFKGEVFLDLDKQFFGPQQRWMSVWHGFLRPTVWWNIWRAKNSGFEGNLKGEGRMLGGLYVIGPGDSGILFEHLESEFGDHANVTEVLNAVKSFKK